MNFLTLVFQLPCLTCTVETNSNSKTFHSVQKKKHKKNKNNKTWCNCTLDLILFVCQIRIGMNSFLMKSWNRTARSDCTGTQNVQNAFWYKSYDISGAGTCIYFCIPFNLDHKQRMNYFWMLKLWKLKSSTLYWINLHVTYFGISLFIKDRSTPFNSNIRISS